MSKYMRLLVGEELQRVCISLRTVQVTAKALLLLLYTRTMGYKYIGKELIHQHHDGIIVPRSQHAPALDFGD